jgi:hypothetical protein
VEILWMDGENPVDEATRKIICASTLRKSPPREVWMRFRTALRLIAAANGVEFVRFHHSHFFSATSVTHIVHRFEHSIGGRRFSIEVAAVAKDRWRAYIARVPGVPAALMPFYGRTPDEAAELLSAWLTRAHGGAKTSTPSV